MSSYLGDTGIVVPGRDRDALINALVSDYPSMATKAQWTQYVDILIPVYQKSMLSAGLAPYRPGTQQGGDLLKYILNATPGMTGTASTGDPSGRLTVTFKPQVMFLDTLYKEYSSGLIGSALYDPKLALGTIDYKPKSDWDSFVSGLHVDITKIIEDIFSKVAPLLVIGGVAYLVIMNLPQLLGGFSRARHKSP